MVGILLWVHSGKRFSLFDHQPLLGISVYNHNASATSGARLARASGDEELAVRQPDDPQRAVGFVLFWPNRASDGKGPIAGGLFAPTAPPTRWALPRKAPRTRWQNDVPLEALWNPRQGVRLWPSEFAGTGGWGRMPACFDLPDATCHVASPNVREGKYAVAQVVQRLLTDIRRTKPRRVKLNI